MQQYIKDYLASKGITKDSSASFDYDSLHDLISGYTPPPSSHQGDVVKDSGIWNEAIEAGRKYQSQVGRLGGDKNTCIAVYADGYIDGQLSQPAPPTSVEGSIAHQLAEKWVFETNGHKWSNNDDTAPDNFGSFIAGFAAAKSHLEEQVKEMQGRKGLVWQPIDQLTKDHNLCKTLIKFDNGEIRRYLEKDFPKAVAVEFMCIDSPAPEQVDVDPNPLTKDALRIELWSMLTGDARKAMMPLKDSYLDSVMADIESYCSGIKNK